MQRIRRRLTYANLMATLAVFLALGGTAIASVIITSNSQIGPGTISGHKPPSGDHANIIAGSINGQDVASNSIGGGKIVKFSGVDACTPTLLAQFGRICAASHGTFSVSHNAMSYRSGLGLRLPSISEAVTLAQNFDVPGVGDTERFWTDDHYLSPSNVSETAVVYEDGVWSAAQTGSNTVKTVCVAYPTN